MVDYIYRDGLHFACQQTVTHPSSNRARCRATITPRRHRGWKVHIWGTAAHQPSPRGYVPVVVLCNYRKSRFVLRCTDCYNESFSFSSVFCRICNRLALPALLFHGDVKLRNSQRPYKLISIQERFKGGHGSRSKCLPPVASQI